MVICHMGQKCLGVTRSYGTDAPGSDNRVNARAESKELAGYVLWLLVVTRMWSVSDKPLGKCGSGNQNGSQHPLFFLFFIYIPNNTVQSAASALNGTWLCVVRRD
jgi:hypothetical protein